MDYGQSPVGQQITPSAGDIVLRPERKSKKLWIILLTGLLSVAIVAVIAVAATRTKSDVMAEQDVARLFNIYANYLLYGEGNDNDIDSEAIDAGVFYIDKIADTPERITYVEALNDKLTDFAEAYYREGENFTSDYLRAYFYDLSKITLLSEEEILRSYIYNGFEATEQQIYSHYAQYDFGNEYIDYYIQSNRKAAVSYLEILAAFDGAGCMNNSEINLECAADLSEYANLGASYSENIVSAYETAQKLRSSAIDEFREIYNEIYNIETDGWAQ